MTWYQGNAVWDDTCNGNNGACGDCDDNEYHIYWPYLYTECDYRCGDNPNLAGC